jgi:hypothetical protein
VALRSSLVEALFDYRPGEWYRPVSKHSAPRLDIASEEAWIEMENLGRLALDTIALSPVQRDTVLARLADIAKLREGRVR